VTLSADIKLFVLAYCIFHEAINMAIFFTKYLGKVNLCLCLPKYHTMKRYALTSALSGGKWLASRFGRFTPRKSSPGIIWIGGCVGPRAGLVEVAKRKIPYLCWESNPSRPSRNLVTVLTELFLIAFSVIQERPN
jgi:hypothetical protein